VIEGTWLLGGMDAETYQWKSCGINGCEEMDVMMMLSGMEAEWY